MKKGLLLTLLAILLTTGVVKVNASDLGVSIDAAYTSKYIWYGYDLYDDKSAFQPSVTFDLYDTGFSATFWASFPGSAGGSSKLGAATGTRASRVDATEYNYIIAYDTSCAVGETFQTDVTLNYIYYDFPDTASRNADAQEIGAGFEWPNVCPFGTVPSYYVGKIWASKSSSALGGNYGGWIHVFGLGWQFELPSVPDQPIDFSVSAVYNDGFASATADHDWSHSVVSLSTDLALCPNLTLTPSLNFQKSMDDSVNNEDELWTLINLNYAF
jgi:hypothetical protein